MIFGGVIREIISDQLINMEKNLSLSFMKAINIIFYSS